MEALEKEVLDLRNVELTLLKYRMFKGENVKFSYRKTDGSIRNAVGTMQQQAIIANIKGTGRHRSQFGQIVYLDLEKMAWRSFKPENFIKLLDNNK